MSNQENLTMGVKRLLVTALFASSALAQSIIGTGTPPGGYFIPSGVNAEGSILIGKSGDFGYRWSAATGFEQLTPPAGVTSVVPYSISADGSTIGGTTHGTDGFRAFRWTSDSGFQILPILPGGTFMYGIFMSGDGSTIVGQANDGTSLYKAVRWTTSTGVRVLTNFAGIISDSRANGSNYDGSIVVGQTYVGGTNFGNRAFRWTSSGMANLGTLPTFNHSKAFCISSDGAVIAGTSSFNWTDTPIHAVRWTSQGIADLGLPAGMTEAQPSCISADGSAIGILSWVDGPRAAYWSAATGVVDLNTYLPSIGIDLSGWFLTRTYGLSADGRTIVGEGSLNGVGQGWIVNLGCLNAPTITSHPASRTACPTATTSFSVTAGGAGPFSYLWQWRPEGATTWLDIHDGNNLNTSGEIIFTALNSTAATITINDLRTPSTREVLRMVHALVSNPCGDAHSTSATLTISMADFNCDGSLDLFDYLDFVSAFANNEPGADFNRDGIIDFFDYLDFVQAFSSGG